MANRLQAQQAFHAGIDRNALGVQNNRVGVHIAVLHIVHSARLKVARNQPGLAIGVQVSCASAGGAADHAHLWDVQHIQVVERDANAQCVGLDVRPGGHAAIFAAHQRARDVALGIVLAHKNGVAVDRAIGLAQVNERRRRVDALVEWRIQCQSAARHRGGDARQSRLCRDLGGHAGQTAPRDGDGNTIEHQNAARDAVDVGDICTAGQCAVSADILGVVVGQSEGAHERVGAFCADLDLHRVGTVRVNEVFVANDVAANPDRVVWVVVKRVAGQQINGDAAVSAFVHKVQAVVKELTEHGGEGAVRQGVGRAREGVQAALGREAGVVKDRQQLLTGRFVAKRFQRSRALVGHQIADHPGRRVGHVGIGCAAGGAGVEGTVLHAGDGQGGVGRWCTGDGGRTHWACGVAGGVVSVAQLRRRCGGGCGGTIRVGDAGEGLVCRPRQGLEHVVAHTLHIADTGRVSHRAQRRIAGVVARQCQLCVDEIDVSLIDQHGVETVSYRLQICGFYFTNVEIVIFT